MYREVSCAEHHVFTEKGKVTITMQTFTVFDVFWKEKIEMK